MGRRKEEKPPPDPNYWSDSRSTDARECEERLRRRLTEKRPATFPLFVAGEALHGAAHYAVWNKRFRRGDKGRGTFFKTARSFFDWWSWGYWPRFIKKKEKPPGIRWKDSDKEYVSFCNFCAELLTGLRWVGPEAPRQLMPVRERNYFRMMNRPAVPFRLLASELPFEVQFGQFLLTGRMDQIWEILPYTPEEGQQKFLTEGGIVIVDLTMGGGPIKWAQLVLYALAARLAVRQDPEFRKTLFWDPKTEEWRYSLAEMEKLLDQARVAVLSLSEGKLKPRRPTAENFRELEETLEEGAELVRRIGRGEKVRANPTDSHCRMCLFNFDCKYAAIRETIDLETGDYEVVASPEKEPELGAEKYFPGWKQGKEVTQEVFWTQPIQLPRSVTTLEAA